jgi:hypothetical protein
VKQSIPHFADALAGNGLLIALEGAAGGALQPVVQPVAQQLPDVAGMVADPGQPLDHGSGAGKRPVVGVEAVRPGTLAQLLVGQARGGPGGAGATQRLLPARLPPAVPAADVLPGDAELVGDLGLGVAGGEQRAGLHADGFEGLAVTQAAGVAAVGGWSHAAMLPGQTPIMSSEGANLFLTRGVLLCGRAKHQESLGHPTPGGRRPQGPER